MFDQIGSQIEFVPHFLLRATDHAHISADGPIFSILPPLALGGGFTEGSWEGDLDGGEGIPAVETASGRIFFFFETFARTVPFVTRLPSHQWVGSLWFDFLLSPFSYFLFSITGLFCAIFFSASLSLFSLSLPLLSFTTESRFRKERALKFSSPLWHFRSVSPDARQTALLRTPRFLSAYLHIHSYNFEILSPLRERDR